VASLAREIPIALVLGGPHALLTVLAVCAAQGTPPVAEAGDGSPAGGFAEDAAARDAVLTALELLTGVRAHARQDLAPGGPIDVLEAMAAGDAAACCPLVYGYVTYSEPGRRPHRLAPAARRPGSRAAARAACSAEPASPSPAASPATTSR